jgi:pSer/pThr/pTyr-binding forkhead associated (FHA) protein
VAASQDATLETATATRNLLPVELIIHDHQGRETGAILYRLPAILGRDETADVHLKDPWTSHRHCEIDQIGTVLVVRNLGSKNGILMQGHRVDESHVFPGDQFTIGQTAVTVQYRRGTQSSTSEAREVVSPPPVPDASRTPETVELLYGVASHDDPKTTEGNSHEDRSK